MPIYNAGRFGIRKVPVSIPNFALARASAATASAAAAISTVTPGIAAANPLTFTAGAITVRNAGKFLVQGYITLDGQGGTAVTGDVFRIQLKRGATLLTAQAEVPLAGSETPTVGFGSLAMIDVSGAAVGTTVTYAIVATNLTGSGTVQVLAGQAQLVIQELAA